jgi:hypothetical protein
LNAGRQVFENQAQPDFQKLAGGRKQPPDQVAGKLKHF